MLVWSDRSSQLNVFNFDLSLVCRQEITGLQEIRLDKAKGVGFRRRKMKVKEQAVQIICLSSRV